MEKIKRTSKNTDNSISHLSVILHFVIGVLFIWMLFGGWLMTKYELKSLYEYHKSLGILLLVLVIARLYWRIKNGFPSQLSPATKWKNRFNKMFLCILLGLSVMFPLTGFLMSMSSGKGVSFISIPIIPKGEDYFWVSQSLNSLTHKMHSNLFLVMSIAITLQIIIYLIFKFVHKNFTLQRILGFGVVILTKRLSLIMKKQVKLALLVAMREELQPLLDIVGKYKEVKLNSSVSSFTFELNGHKVVAVLTGIGKSQAAMATTMLQLNYDAQYILNFGTSGAFAQDLEITDQIVANEVVYGDVDLTAFGYEFGQHSKQPARYKIDEKLNDLILSLGQVKREGLIVTCDSFIVSEAQRSFVLEKLPQVQALDMEVAAIGHVCHNFDIKFSSIKGISDKANGESADDFTTNLNKAAERLAQTIVKLCEVI